MLDRLLTGAPRPAELRRTLAHVTQPCATCQDYLSRALDADAPDPAERAAAARTAALGTTPLDTTPPHPARPTPGLDAIRAERLRAAVLWSALEATPPPQRLRRIETDPRTHTWELAARCLEAAADCPWQDPPRSLLACRLALAIVERLPTSSYTPALRHDLRARALGHLADALRLDEQLDAARLTLRRARRALARGTRHPLERAALLRTEAGLRLDTGDPAGAAALLRPAVTLYRRFGDTQQEARTLERLARAVGHDNPAHGAALARRATTLLDPGREPTLDLAARHVLIWCLNDCGLPARALDELDRARPLYQACRDTEPHLMRPWLEARICRRLGELAAAERALAAVWHDFRRAGFRRELTLVSLDLAATYLAQGKTRHALRLLTAFHESLRRYPLHPEGLAAWLLTLQTVQHAQEAAAAQALLHDAALYFRRAWIRPAPFAPPQPLPHLPYLGAPG